MIKFFFKTLLPIVIAMAAFFVVYNYFLGTPEEREQSVQIAGQVKDLTGSVVTLLASEKEKYDAGKYDAALAKIREAIGLLKEKAATMKEGGELLLDRVKQLEETERSIQEKVNQLKAPVESTEPTRAPAQLSTGEEETVTAELPLTERRPGRMTTAAPETPADDSLDEELLKLNAELRQLAIDSEK